MNYHIDLDGFHMARESYLTMIVRTKLIFDRWYGMICCYVLAFLSGFGVFVTWETASFFSNYLSIGIYVGCFVGWKFFNRTTVSVSALSPWFLERMTNTSQFVKASEVDLKHGRSTDKGHREIRVIEDAEDRLKSPIRRVYEWIL